MHRRWCDEKNYDVTFFGIDNELMKLSQIRFDMLHLKLSVTCKILAYVRTFLFKKHHDIQK